jgi:hypothetical protein
MVVGLVKYTSLRHYMSVTLVPEVIFNGRRIAAAAAASHSLYNVLSSEV